MPRKSLLTLTFCALACVLVPAATRDIIPAGTLLQCTLDEPNFSSKTAVVGDPVLCHLGPLNSFGHSVFPRGAVLSGHLQDYKDPGHFVGKGWIQLEFDRMILPGAEVLPLSAKIISAPHMKVDRQGEIRGKGHPKRDAVLWAVPVFWPIKIITLPARGPYPTLKGETRITLRLMEDVEVPFAVARNAVPMPPWATPSSYHFSYDASSYVTGRNSGLAPDQPVTMKPATYSQPTPQLAVTPSAEQTTTVIALRGGSAYLAREYWVQDGQLHCISVAGEQKMFPLERIDLGQTVQINQQRNVDFVLQSKDAVEQ